MLWENVEAREISKKKKKKNKINTADRRLSERQSSERYLDKI